MRRISHCSPSGNECPMNLLTSLNVQQLHYWLSRFVTEVRKQDGLPYPPRTIQQILAGLQREMLQHNSNTPKFVDTEEMTFRELRDTCGAVYCDLQSQGRGKEVRYACTFFPEDESKLWESGVLGYTTPNSLKHAVFHYAGKCYHFSQRQLCRKAWEKCKGFWSSQQKAAAQGWNLRRQRSGTSMT